MDIWDAAWLQFWRVFGALGHGRRMAAIRCHIAEALFDQKAAAEANVALHQKQIGCLQAIERNAAEADLVLPTSREVLVEITRVRLMAIREVAKKDAPRSKAKPHGQQQGGRSA